jgi:hypothetical protein
MSGIGSRNMWPYISRPATWSGSWSTDVAEKRFFVRIARMSEGMFTMLPT